MQKISEKINFAHIERLWAKFYDSARCEGILSPKMEKIRLVAAKLRKGGLKTTLILKFISDNNSLYSKLPLTYVIFKNKDIDIYSVK